MKIVYVFRSLAVWGGIERILVDKMNWLVAHGHEVCMITADQGQHTLPYQMDSRIRMTDLCICFHHQYRYSGWRRLVDVWQRQRRFQRKLREQLRASGPDVIVCTTANYVGTLARLKGRVPLVVESHSICNRLVDNGRMRGVRRWWQRRMLRRADMLVALTEGDAAEWRKWVDHVAVIPNMVHVPQPTPLSSPAARRVIFAGRFEPQKQLDHLLTIWQKARQRHPGWTLAIYGEGSQRDWLLSEVALMDASIEVFPPTDHIFECYAQASILVLTSSFEPFGLVLPEAMLCGVPVVSYDCPYGPRAIITDGEDGLLARPQDADDFANKLCQLMDDEELRRRMGSKAAMKARHYEAHHVMPLWEKLFQDLSK